MVSGTTAANCVGVGDVALGLLGERGDPVADELVAGCPGDPVDPEGEGGMLQHRVVAEGHDLVEKRGDVGAGEPFLEFVDG